MTDEFESLIAGIEAEHRRVVTAMEKDYADLASQLGQAIRERDDLRRQLSGVREAFEELRNKLFPPTIHKPVLPNVNPYAPFSPGLIPGIQPIPWTVTRTTASDRTIAVNGMTVPASERAQ